MNARKMGWMIVPALLLVGAGALTAGCVAAHGAPVGTADTDLMVQGVLAAVTVVGFVLVHHRRRHIAIGPRHRPAQVPR